MDDSLTPIPGAIEMRESLPRPNWNAIANWLESNVEPDSFHETWASIARDWLGRLAQSLPSGYAVHESSEFLLLTADPLFAKQVLRLCEHARRTILQTLDGVACEEGLGKYVVLLFADAESYYDYVTDFYPDEGEFALSGGIFLNDGYGHIAMIPYNLNDCERTIAHELNHAVLRHLPLPLWLNEGVTQFMEDMVVGSSQFMIDLEIVRRHRSYWNDETIHQFWSGDSFHSPDGQELSYHLSQVLFRNLISDFPKKVKAVLNNANSVDAGNAAFIDACQVTLADRVSQFLGPGDWTPRSD